MRRLGFLLAVTSAIFLCAAAISPGQAYACSCAVEAGVTKQERVEDAFARSGLVFAGEVADIESSSATPGSTGPVTISSMDPVTVTFDISETWKGSQAKTQEITTPMSGASCGYEFQSGKEYLVYAPESKEVLLCGETKPLSKAKTDLKVLGNMGVLPDTSGIAAPYAVAKVAGLAAILAAPTLVLISLVRSSRRP